MKNSLNLCLAILLLVILGCTCPKLSELGKREAPPPPRPETSPVASSTPLVTAKGEYDVTMAKFDRVKVGVKRAEVEGVFGGAGTEYYSGKGGGSTFISVKYVGDNYKTIFVSYRNDTVTSKTQAGLK